MRVLRNIIFGALILLVFGAMLASAETFTTDDGRPIVAVPAEEAVKVEPYGLKLGESYRQGESCESIRRIQILWEEKQCSWEATIVNVDGVLIKDKGGSETPTYLRPEGIITSLGISSMLVACSYYLLGFFTTAYIFVGISTAITIVFTISFGIASYIIVGAIAFAIIAYIYAGATYSYATRKLRLTPFYLSVVVYIALMITFVLV